MCIVWVVCRVREKIDIRQNFRCWTFGHLARDCKGTDRSDWCHHRCGEAGHKSAAWNMEQKGGEIRAVQEQEEPSDGELRVLDLPSSSELNKRQEIRILQLNLNHCKAA